MAPPPKSPHLYLVEDRGYRSRCWIWQRAVNTGGYGVVRTGEGSRTISLAHRVFYERKHGPIPDGLEPDHLCQQTLCVRPSHMDLVTHAENVRRGRRVKLTAAKAERIRRLLARGRRVCDVAETFEVSESLIRNVRDGDRWATV